MVVHLIVVEYGNDVVLSVLNVNRYLAAGDVFVHSDVNNTPWCGPTTYRILNPDIAAEYVMPARFMSIL